MFLLIHLNEKNTAFLNQSIFIYKYLPTSSTTTKISPSTGVTLFYHDIVTTIVTSHTTPVPDEGSVSPVSSETMVLLTS